MGTANYEGASGPAFEPYQVRCSHSFIYLVRPLNNVQSYEVWPTLIEGTSIFLRNKEAQ
jgi:hypothetical protein